MQNLPVAELVLIESWIARGQLDRALPALESLALAHPRDARIWKNLGVVQQQRGQSERAETLLRHALTLDDTDVDAHCSLGGVYRASGRLQEAQDAFEHGLQRSGGRSMFALLNLLLVHAARGTLTEARVAHAEELVHGRVQVREDIRTGHNLPWACFDQAQLLLLDGDLAGCCEALTQGVRLATAAWQVDTAAAAYRQLAGAGDPALRAAATEPLTLLDTLKSRYFAAPGKRRCFVIMPFGRKLDAAGVEVDFDEVYKVFIKPMVESEGLECIRCDEVDEAGNIHQRMFRLLWRADVAIADVSLANPNVFYELGIRHALRSSVTVIIRNRHATLPFNIANLNAVEYDVSGGGDDEAARTRIRRSIAAGLKDGHADSVVTQTLDLRIADRAREIGSCEVYRYPVGDTGRHLALITGDLRNVRGIEVWVNSENTNMQMARFYDFAISSVIRFEGARRTRTGHVAEDLIQSELTALMEGEREVEEAEVLASGPGELSKKYGVQAVFHAASVRGAVGRGYEPVGSIHRCITNSLALMDDPERNAAGRLLKTILFPLLGIGFVRGDYRPMFERQVEAALEYLSSRPDSAIQTIYFLAWSEQELALCQSVFRGVERLREPVRAI